MLVRSFAGFRALETSASCAVQHEVLRRAESAAVIRRKRGFEPVIRPKSVTRDGNAGETDRECREPRYELPRLVCAFALRLDAGKTLLNVAPASRRCPRDTCRSARKASRGSFRALQLRDLWPRFPVATRASIVDFCLRLSPQRCACLRRLTSVPERAV